METDHTTIKKKSIFISRSIEKSGTLYKFLEKEGLNIIDLPLIKFVKIPFSYTPPTDWIFFSSKNAIKYFFEQNPSLQDGVKFGVISRSSEYYLNQYGKQADFVGQGVDLIKISQQFRDVLADQSVLFPQAMDSLQTIQKQLAFTNTVHNIYTYKTILRSDFEIPYTDIVVLTSPSNVKAFYSKYKIDNRQLVIAMGNSTKYALSEYGFKKVIIPEEFSEDAICDIISRNNS